MKVPDETPELSLREYLSRYGIEDSSKRDRRKDRERVQRKLPAPINEQDSVLPGIEVTYLDL